MPIRLPKFSAFWIWSFIVETPQKAHPLAENESFDVLVDKICPAFLL